jgi:carbon starvation protein
VLFVTIACGACSGFHALIASGTTSKQLKTEGDARSVGYGAMLLEAMVAIISLCCVMMIDPASELGKDPKPNLIYATGIGSFMGKFGVAPQFAVSFALMAFTTFVYDTLDVCTRLGRYIIQELTGLRGAAGKWIGTLITAGVPAYFVTKTFTGADGKPVAIWRIFWNLFGASNQLLAALTLLGVTVWLWQTRRAWWVWIVTGLPAIWMYAMSSWALVSIIKVEFAKAATSRNSEVAWIAVVLVALAAVMLLEAVVAVTGGWQPPSAREPEPAAA